MVLAKLVAFRNQRKVLGGRLRSTALACTPSCKIDFSSNDSTASPSHHSLLSGIIHCRSYFTNGQVTKKDDPYAILGLSWGDGASTAEIRQAFRNKARELHPDVVDTSKMSLEQAQQAFQKLTWAYEALLKHVQADVDHDSIEEWRVALWRQSDRIALDRTDVAGSLRQRPKPPAQTEARKAYGRELGHPSGKGIVRGEYLAAGSSNGSKGKLRSSSVGRGQSKWVQSAKGNEYKEWKPS